MAARPSPSGRGVGERVRYGDESERHRKSSTPSPPNPHPSLRATLRQAQGRLFSRREKGKTQRPSSFGRGVGERVRDGDESERRRNSSTVSAEPSSVAARHPSTGSGQALLPEGEGKEADGKGKSRAPLLPGEASELDWAVSKEMLVTPSLPFVHTGDSPRIIHSGDRLRHRTTTPCGPTHLRKRT
jgi:hypothetical protein